MISQSSSVIAGSLRNISKYSDSNRNCGKLSGLQSRGNPTDRIQLTYTISQMLGAKVQHQEGNSPERSLRCANITKSECQTCDSKVSSLQSSLFLMLRNSAPLSV